MGSSIEETHTKAKIMILVLVACIITGLTIYRVIRPILEAFNIV